MLTGPGPYRPPMQPLITYVTLADYAARYRIALTCPACGRERWLDYERMAALYGWQAKLANLRPRLTCGKCGRRSPEVRVVWVQPDPPAATRHAPEPAVNSNFG